jgi:hypothetical protein
VGACARTKGSDEVRAVGARVTAGDARARPGVWYHAPVELDPSGACPRCGAARAVGPECPRCGVIYAKAHPRAAHAPTEALAVADVAPLAVDPFGVPWSGGLEAARLELALRATVPPLALAAAALLVSSGAGHALVRTFLSMWVHELGHAVAAWLCGLAAFPGPWRTPVSAGRVALVPLVVAAALGLLVYRGRRERRPGLATLGAAGLLAQAACLALSPRAVGAFVTFAGDGGCFVLGTLLMASVYAREESRLRRGALRWGLVGIGAASVVDALDTWLRARADVTRIPLGEIEGVGLSDASKLTEVYGWSYAELTGRYVALGAACAVAIAVMYGVGVARARAECAAIARSRPRPG